MSAQWPRVKSWVAAKLPTLPGWSSVTVFAGTPTTGDSPQAYATVGYVRDGEAGSYSQTRSDDGFRWVENGELHCQLVCTSGDMTPGTFEASVFALIDALEANLRADRSLGGTLPPDSQVDLDVTVQQFIQGTAATLVLTIRYLTVT